MEKFNNLIKKFNDFDTGMKITTVVFALVVLLTIIEGANLLGSYLMNRQEDNNQEINQPINIISGQQTTTSTKPVTQGGNILPTQGIGNTTANLPLIVEVEDSVSQWSKDMHNNLVKIQKDYYGIVNVRFVTPKDKELWKKYPVKRFPTQIVFDSNGKEVFRHEGYATIEQITAKMVEFGIVKK